MSERDLAAEVEALRERVAALEAWRETGRDLTPSHDPEVFWALEGLRERLDEHPATSGGAVMIVGAVRLPTGEPVDWQQAAGGEGLLEGDWSHAAGAFAALGHPVRIELLRHVLRGVRTTAELGAIESLGSTGQLHHHLRQLLAAGWLRQAGRGSYEVPVARIVPLLTSLMGVGT